MLSFEVEDRIEEHLEAALVSPTPLAHDLQARIYLSYYQFDKAVQEAEKAIALDSNNATAHAALANVLVLAGQPEEGAEAIGKAMRLDPHYPPSYLEILGATQFWTGKYDKAIETVKQAIERNPENDIPRLYLAAGYARLGRINEGEAAMEAANYARNLRGLSALSMEKSNDSGYSPFMAAIDFLAFGQKQNQDQIRADILKIPALNWPFLVTTHASSTLGQTWWEVEGATQIDAATAKSMHARGVKFIDTGYESDWLEIHISGAHSLPYHWVYLNKSSPDGGRNVLNRVTLGEIVDKSDEVVFYLCSKINTGDCSAPWSAAKAVSWGYQKVYFIDLSSTREWMKAGYTQD
jgi:adenylate cyclase